MKGRNNIRRHTVGIRRCIGPALVAAAVAALVFGVMPVGAGPSNTPTPSSVIGRAKPSPATSPSVPPATNATLHPPARPVVRAVDDHHGPLDYPTASPLPHSDIRPLLRPVVVLYGDSLAWEAQDAFVQALADRSGLTVVVRTFGGTAICDWLDEMADDATTLAPGAVVVEFSGNAMTPCMHDSTGQPLTGTAFAERYAADAEKVIATFAPIGAQVVFAGAPISRSAEESGDFNGGRLNALYAQMGRIHDDVRYVDAGAAVLESGHWTATLPCLPVEPCTGGFDAAGHGVNVVRAPDGAHFCPASADAVRGVTGECPVWSSGAFRYGNALAHPVIESLDVPRSTPSPIDRYA